MIKDKSTSVLRRVIAREKSLNPQVARAFLRWNFSESEERRLDELVRKSRRIGLSDREVAEFQEYCVVADILSLLHARAKSALQRKLKTTGV